MHTLEIPSDADRATVHAELLASIRALVTDEPDLVANLANISAAIKQALPHVSWVGFYRQVGPDLVLGPFQGKLACTRIPAGKGVCGAAAARRETVLVPDVHAFPGHIACDAGTRSEIVVPIVRAGQVLAVLDLDSEQPAAFDAADIAPLEAIAAVVADLAWTD
jgi:GAF domain-containing protein